MYKTYLTVKIEEGKGRYDDKSRTIFIPNLSSIEDLYALLHEMGHAHHHHVPDHWGGGYATEEDYLHEVEAWRYAISCIKEEYRLDMVEFAIKCLDTYRGRIETVWGIMIPQTKKEELV